MSLKDKKVWLNGSDYIELESVGTAIDSDGITHPMFADGTIDMDEGMAVHIMDCESEWWESMSCQDAVRLFPFLANISELYMTQGYLQWAMDMGDLVVEANNQMSLYGASIEEDWDFDEAVNEFSTYQIGSTI